MHDEQSSFRYDSSRFFAALRMTKEVLSLTRGSPVKPGMTAGKAWDDDW